MGPRPVLARRQHARGQGGGAALRTGATSARRGAVGRRAAPSAARFEVVAVAVAGFAVQRRQRERAGGRAWSRVLIGDSMGELFAYYATCDVAFVGGSLLDHGSQNLIEASRRRPAGADRAVDLQPQLAAEQALECGACGQIGTAAESAWNGAGTAERRSCAPAHGGSGREFARRQQARRRGRCYCLSNPGRPAAPTA